jgi:hypothetical protein
MPNKKTLKQNKRSRNRKGGFFGWFKSKPKEGGIDCDRTDYTDIRDMENYIRDCECANKSWYNFNGKKRCKKVQDNLDYKSTQEVNNPIDYARENQSNIVDMFTSIYSPVKYNYYKADLRRDDKLAEILQSIKFKIGNDPAIIEQFNTYSTKLIEFNKEKLIQELKEYKTLSSDTFQIREKEREYFPRIQKLANMESLLNNNVDEFRPTISSTRPYYQEQNYQEEDTQYQPLPSRDADMGYRGYKAQGHFQQPYYSSQGNYVMPQQNPIYGYGGKIRKTKKHFNKRSIKGRNSKRRKH